MKYEEEIDEILKELLFEEWMTDSEYDEIISQTFEQMDITKERLSNDLVKGVKIGYPVEVQLNLLREILK